MQIRRWFSYEYDARNFDHTRQHTYVMLQIGQRVFTLRHSVGPWVDSAFNRVEV